MTGGVWVARKRKGKGAPVRDGGAVAEKKKRYGRWKGVGVGGKKGGVGTGGGWRRKQAVAAAGRRR